MAVAVPVTVDVAVAVAVAVDVTVDEDEFRIEGVKAVRDSACKREPEHKGPGLDSTSPDLFNKSLFEKALTQPLFTFSVGLTKTPTMNFILSEARFRKRGL